MSLTRAMLAGFAVIGTIAAPQVCSGEKVQADLGGRVLLFEQDGLVERDMTARLTLRSELGRIEEIELYTEWSGPLGARQKSWEFYAVRGTQYAGYVERLYTEDSGTQRFNRTEVSGAIDQDVDAQSGSASISWTIGDSNDTAVDEDEDAADRDVDLDGVPDDIDTDIEEPEVTALEEGTLRVVLARTINVNGDRDGDTDSPEVLLFEEGDEVLFEGLARRQEAELAGEGDGSLAFDEDEADRERDEAIDEAEPDPTPSPSPSPSPTPTIDGFFDDGTFDDGTFDDGTFDDGTFDDGTTFDGGFGGTGTTVTTGL